MRVEMAEPYRTLLGHLRHEVGHYYWQVLVQGQTDDAFRAVFGDERVDYAQALQRHYSQGPAPAWGRSFVSAYATAHPWEDWAETFAHYLHIRDTVQTAGAYGLVVTGPQERVAHPHAHVAVPRPEAGSRESIDSLVDTWLPLTYALNAVNRSMGKDDLYPFLLPVAVVDKLRVVHDLVLARAAASNGINAGSPQGPQEPAPQGPQEPAPQGPQEPAPAGPAMQAAPPTAESGPGEPKVQGRGGQGSSWARRAGERLKDAARR
jgi:hypothetical protein